jgi:uncharacterized protein YdaU (DUF1376 family)
MKPPAFQFYPDDFIGGTCDLSAKEVGAYIRLLCFQWSKGKIPSDRNKLSRIAGTNVTPEVIAKFADGMNQRLEFERIKQSEHREAKKKAGENGAKKRWQNHSTPINLLLANGMANTIANDSSPSPSPLPIKSSTNSKKKVKVEMLDEEWMASLKTDPNNQGINVDMEYSKACAWCVKNHTSLSRRRFENWLERANREKPIAIVAKQPMPSVTGGIQLGAINGRWVSCL